jgi:FemAB-related protein (PEP-CTERM system-associated)
MIIEELRKSDEGAWDGYVDAHPRANCYHLRAWKTAAEEAYGFAAPFLLARDRAGGRVCGVLPLFAAGAAGVGRGGYLTTGLFGAYGPVLADDPGTADALVAAAIDRSRARKARFLVVKALGAEPPAGFEPLDHWVIAKLALAPDPDTVWRRFRDKTRNAIRKGQRSGLEVRVGPRYLEGFYDVLAENMHRKGAPIYGRSLFEELLGALGSRGEIVTLEQDGRTVSGALVIRFGDVVTVPFASSRPSSFHLNPNNLLYWEIISRSCRAGARTLDFGRSLRDSTALSFKLGWGSTTEAQPMFVRALRGAAPRFDVAAPSIRFLTGVWRSLPRNLADALGPAVCRRWLA